MIYSNENAHTTNRGMNSESGASFNVFDVFRFRYYATKINNTHKLHACASCKIWVYFVTYSILLFKKDLNLALIIWLH